MERQKTQNIQHSLEAEQSWKTDRTQLQNLLQSYGNKDSMILVKE